MPKAVHKALEEKLGSLRHAAKEWEDKEEESEEGSEEENDESLEDDSVGGDLDFIQDEEMHKKGEIDGVQGIAGTKQEGVVYIGHLPRQMEEEQLIKFLNQFGPVSNVRVSRSSKSGRARGYAFVKFVEGYEVAKVVSETLSGYFVMKGERRLVCHVVEPHKVHPDMFTGVGGKTSRQRTSVWTRQIQRRNRFNNNFDDSVNAKTDDAKGSNSVLHQKSLRLSEKEELRRAKLRAIGMGDYADAFPGFKASQDRAKVLADTKTLESRQKEEICR